MSFWTDLRDTAKIVVAAYIVYASGGSLASWSLLLTATSDVYGRDQRRKAGRQARQDFLNTLARRLNHHLKSQRFVEPAPVRGVN